MKGVWQDHDLSILHSTQVDDRKGFGPRHDQAGEAELAVFA